MKYDNKDQPGVDKFMDFSGQEEDPLAPSSDYSPSAKFMQQGVNAYAKNTGGTLLKEDGVVGPKTMAGVQDMIKTLPPEMKKWAVNKLHKEAGKMKGNAPDDSELNPLG